MRCQYAGQILYRQGCTLTNVYRTSPFLASKRAAFFLARFWAIGVAANWKSEVYREPFRGDSARGIGVDVLMRLRMRILLLLAALVALAAVGWGYACRQELVRQVALYRVGAAASYDEARQAIAWFELQPGRSEKLRELVRKWGTGNEPFDRYLARYVSDPASGEARREAFSLNLAWNDEHLPRWANYWQSRSGSSPEQRTRSLLAHLDLLLDAPSPPSLTWREVLDLQAVFTLAGHPRLAHRLSPENWSARYRLWRGE